MALRQVRGILTGLAVQENGTAISTHYLGAGDSPGRIRANGLITAPFPPQLNNEGNPIDPIAGHGVIFTPQDRPMGSETGEAAKQGNGMGPLPWLALAALLLA